MEKATPDGVLLVDKPAGMTSHDVVAIVRRASGVGRIGHAGTLDPFATGLLVLLGGNGTRLLPYMDGEPKVYDATIRFGSETDTDDRTGSITREAPLPEPGLVDAAIANLTGDIEQIPPAYSAKKVAGRRAYAAARRGESLELAPVRVTIHSWTVLRRTAGSIDARIVCSGGTYVRALARDLGRLANSAAHLAELRRMASGPFRVDDAQPLDAIRIGAPRWLPLTAAIPRIPLQRLDASAAARVQHGNPVPATVDAPRVALIDESGELLGLGESRDGRLQPRLVLRHA